MTFLVARPEHKAEQTAAHLAQKGLQAYAFPVLNITPENSEQNKTHFLQFITENENKTLIITSTYAASFVRESILSQQALTYTKGTINIIAIGHATAKAVKADIMTQLTSADSKSKANMHLERHVAVRVVLHVAQPETSEGALDLPHLHEVENHAICIVKGFGGRCLLQNELQKRGALVKVLEVYRRNVNLKLKHNYTFEPREIKCIIATSAEIADALRVDIFADQYNWLASLPWIVPSERIKLHLQKCDIANIYLSQGASAEALTERANQLVTAGALNV
jgi:uroporphyrinogen-III synthase